MRRALVLIPCSARKEPNGGADSEPGPILNGLADFRNIMVEAIRNNPTLANNNANSEGILNPEAKCKMAKNLYRGKLDNNAREVLDGITPDCDLKVLIVSGLYGLVQLHEGIRNYELKMENQIEINGKLTTPYRFWRENELWRVLCRYIRDNKISNIWSLLPKTPPYHQLIEPVFDQCEDNGIIVCRHVFPRRMQSAAGGYRGRWLLWVYKNQKELLFCDNPPNNQEITFDNGRVVVFEYRNCN